MSDGSDDRLRARVDMDVLDNNALGFPDCPAIQLRPFALLEVASPVGTQLFAFTQVCVMERCLYACHLPVFSGINFPSISPYA
jgi:hypothetical protein